MVENFEVTILAERICSTPEMCAVLGIRSSITLGKLERAGWIKRAGKNQWALGATVQGYVKSLREGRHANAAAATARLREAQLLRIELDSSREARSLIRMTEAEEVIDILGGAVLVELGGLPGRVTRNLSDRTKLEGEVFAMRTRIANKMEEMARRLAGECEAK